jgi:hypothetical protein
MTAIVKSATPVADRRFFAGLWTPRLAAATLTLLAIPACSRLGSSQHREMDWARAALERNEQLQVVASDPQARTFTVRLKDSDELRVLSIDQIVAGPGGPAEAARQSAAAPVPASAGAAATNGAATNGAATNGAATNGAATSEAGTAGASAAQTATQNNVASAEQGGAPAQESSSTAGATDQATPSSPTAAGPHAERAADAKAGSVLASGPGYTIKASGAQPTPTRQATGQTAARGTPLERLHDPIICQGSRLLHIDNRNLEFDGDAVTAEQGCEIHITNSHIRAKGIGVQARAASVHIENSEIDGDGGSIDASDGAQVYAEGSRFKGLTRHMEASAFHDLGGNVWN